MKGRRRMIHKDIFQGTLSVQAQGAVVRRNYFRIHMISHALISDSVLDQELTRTPLGCRALWGYKHKGAVSTVVVVA